MKMTVIGLTLFGLGNVGFCIVNLVINHFMTKKLSEHKETKEELREELDYLKTQIDISQTHYKRYKEFYADVKDAIINLEDLVERL